MTLKCPDCGSTNVGRYSNNGIDCNTCGNMGRAEEFGAKCTCSQPHHTPMWYCAVHGEVVVPMD
jgi:hypothetical protein